MTDEALGSKEAAERMIDAGAVPEAVDPLAAEGESHGTNGTAEADGWPEVIGMLVDVWNMTANAVAPVEKVRISAPEQNALVLGLSPWLAEKFTPKLPTGVTAAMVAASVLGPKMILVYRYRKTKVDARRAHNARPADPDTNYVGREDDEEEDDFDEAEG
jgi:hypothetical protein